MGLIVHVVCGVWCVILWAFDSTKEKVLALVMGWGNLKC